MQNNLEIYNETKNFPIKNWVFLYEKFGEIKNEILGKNFALSINILLPKNAKKINLKIRKKTYTPNTLSFKYSKNSGEIILCPNIISKEKYEILRPISLQRKIAEKPTSKLHLIEKFENKLLYLFIHSCLHLAGLDHSKKMDTWESKIFSNHFLI